MTMKIRVNGLQTQLMTAKNILAEIPETAMLAQTPIEGYGTIGQQFRHLINYVEVLLRDYPKGHVDFSDRDRVERLETDKDFIIQRLEELSQEVEFFLDKDPDETLKSLFVVVADQPPVIDGADLGFLINYVSDHAYHHVSTIKILSAWQGIPVNVAGGVAPATQLYELKRA